MRANELVIDDSNFNHPSLHPAEGRGLIPRDYERVPHGSMLFATKAEIEIIDPSEWDDRIAEGEKTESFLSHLRLRHGIPSQNQGQTNYCWAHGPVSAMMISRAKDNQPYVKLAATAVAAQVTGYRNTGGWGGDALNWIVKNGVPTIDYWTPNVINRKFDTPEMRANAALHKVIEWNDLGNRDFKLLMTFLLLRIPVAVGYNWWSHEVCALDPVKLGNNTYGVRIWNSWGDSWSAQGMSVLEQSKATPDDAVAPRVISPTNESIATGIAV